MSHVLAYRIASFAAGMLLLWRAPSVYVGGFVLFLVVNYYGWQRMRKVVAERGPEASHTAFERMLSHAPLKESPETYLAEIDNVWFAVVFPAVTWPGGVLWLAIAFGDLLLSRRRYRELTAAYEDAARVHQQIAALLSTLPCLDCNPDAEIPGGTLLRGRRLYLKASISLERAAALTDVKTSEGQKARIEAVCAALYANMFLRADRLVARFVSEKGAPPGFSLALTQIVESDLGGPGVSAARARSRCQSGRDR